MISASIESWSRGVSWVAVPSCVLAMLLRACHRLSRSGISGRQHHGGTLLWITATLTLSHQLHGGRTAPA